jgi:hypothetical protein
MSHRSEILNILIGIGLLILCHITYLMLAGLLTRLLGLASTILPVASILPDWIRLSVFGLGLVQALYVVPLCLYLDRRQQHAVVMGILIGAVLTLLLNGGCFVLFFSLLPS